ncbi:heme o synthase [Neobacillus massiliamazoniensis]|uniref:Protoheme IX farnesyltransferase n=1 Tax=Neobacillus massiliamazoniensis TaxID=1499688 RepID=A0A0U1P3W6_9BACI|nr:heme o synthase [Neobacillus massiliamazoniensis]CRK84930.1 protoheme IX farnesyltransferase [Neobacillus massiliamazoniensis]
MSVYNEIQQESTSRITRWPQLINSYIEVTKPKILVMLIFTSLCAAFVAQRGIPSLTVTFAMLLSASLSAGGSAAINMWYDRDIDVIMERTAKRPIPAGSIDPRSVLWFGILLGILSVVIALLFVNPLTAILNATGYLYYAVFYTMWLKRRTPQNIVIGGGAGAFPILIGWASVTGSLNTTAWLMFMIIFLWTPPHTWALALFKNDEYTKAGIPMMPVVKGARYTKSQSLFYMILLFINSLFLYISGSFNVFYLFGAIIFNSFLLYCTWKMFKEPDGTFIWAKRTFIFSIFYILGIFTSMVIGII